MSDRIKQWLACELATGPFMVVVRWTDGSCEELFRIESAETLDDDAEALIPFIPIGGKGTLDSVH